MKVTYEIDMTKDDESQMERIIRSEDMAYCLNEISKMYDIKDILNCYGLSLDRLLP